MKQLYGTVLGYDSERISAAKVELYGKNDSIESIYAGTSNPPISTTISDSYGNYILPVDDILEGTIYVPEQTVGNMKISANHANVNTEKLAWNYIVVVQTRVYDPHDTDFSGQIDIPELVAWMRDIETTRLTSLDEKISQLERKFKMFVEVILPLILKK